MNDGRKTVFAVLCPFFRSERKICMRKQPNRNNWNLLPRHKRAPRTPERCTSGSRNNTALAHSQKAVTRDSSSSLPIRSVLDEDRQTEMKNKFLRAFRTAGAAAKRGWRTLARVRQHGFFPAQIGCTAGSRSRAHTLCVTGIYPALRSPRTQGAAAFAANAATNANQKYNRDRVDSSPLPFPIPVEHHAFKPETER